MGNGIKFTRQGRVTVQAYPSQEQPSNAVKICFQVQDTGIGIPRNNLKKVFKPFEQGFDVYTREFEGAGLGLALVKRNIEILGGSIEISSQVDQGTTFFFEIPFYPPPEDH
ncbi:MAG: ATP-binding protein [Desulfonatronovibrionaceae bacterium]